jgi:hypothetical protein
MDAVVVLIEEQMKAGRKSLAFDWLIELDREINAIKTRAAATRLDHVITDLAALKKNAPKEYGRVAAALREVLK